jgi:hypothetical protein
MAKTLTQMVKETTPTDILLTGVFLGVLAGVSGAAAWLDKNLTSNGMGFKSNMSKKSTIPRGALVGAIISLPFAYLSTTSVANMGSPAYNANVSNVFVNPGRYDEPPAAPKDYIYAKDPTGAGNYLIIDPKYGL